MLTYCLTYCPSDFQSHTIQLLHLKQQTKAPDRILIASSGLTQEQLDTIPKVLTLKGKDVPVDYVNHFEWTMLPGGVRNLALSACKTEYIMFFDGGDDYVHPQRIEFTCKAFEDLNVDVFYTNYEWCYVRFEEFKELGEIYPIKEYAHGHPAIKGKYVIAQGPVALNVKKVFWDKGVRYHENMRWAEDGSFGICCIEAKCNVYATEKKLMVYRARNMGETYRD